MLLRTSISKYKKFFQKTLNNFKSLFSPSYQKIPKTPLHDQSSYNELDKFYSDFTEKWDSEKGKSKKRSKNKVMLSSSTKQVEEEARTKLHDEGLVSLNNELQKREKFEEQKIKKSLIHQRGNKQDSSSMLNSKRVVEKKLKELEMLEMSNVDYILDIEEVLHYYSRLTCPLYIEIVDKFFMEMYSEFFGCPETPASVNSKLQKMRSVTMRS
ncbi:uncharacterized protein LOC123915455 [Trifolium pratense]|uniref:uncharacterized protein LOC123915455 n=1 Tax=Trifolium pratense TaxID=57577 RepID=UPI001E697295|nr:uncharacterized protein LOC123915455 [Trifolium pratense]